MALFSLIFALAYLVFNLVMYSDHEDTVSSDYVSSNNRHEPIPLGEDLDSPCKTVPHRLSQ